MFMLNVANLSNGFPIWVTPEEYESLKQKKTGGWSNCDTQMEWMVKLHYLRKGFKERRITAAVFFEREQQLVLNWWLKWC
jgi:hypothetical protein